jgi:hypothetical protein
LPSFASDSNSRQLDSLGKTRYNAHEQREAFAHVSSHGREQEL